MPPKLLDRHPDPASQLARIAESYDSKVRLLFQLQNYISLVKYDPNVAKKDKTAEFRRFVTAGNYDIWDVLQKKSDTRKTSKRIQKTRKEIEDAQIELRQLQMLAEREGNSPSKALASNRLKRVRLESSAKSARVQQHQTGASKRRRSDQGREGSDSSDGEHGMWDFDSDVCLPDLPHPIKRMRQSYLVTHPSHFVKTSFQGDLEKLLSSYKTLSDDQEPISSEQWEKRVRFDAEAFSRVKAARASGLLAKLEAEGVGKRVQFVKFNPPPASEPSYYENLLNHAIYHAKQRSNLRKFHQTIIKRTAQCVEQYFRRLVGAEDRELKELERQVRQTARRISQEVMKKWKLAQKVVEQRREAVLAEVKREKGKEYLNQILDNSAKLIEARVGEPHEDLSDNETDENNGEEDIEQSERGDSSSDEFELRDDNNDAHLSLEELRKKYENLPNLSASDDSSDLQSTDEENGSNSDNNRPNRGLAGGHTVTDEVEKPSAEALNIYAELKDEDESELSSGSDSSFKDSSSEDEGPERPGLASLFCSTLADDENDLSVAEDEPSGEEFSRPLTVDAESDQEILGLDTSKSKTHEKPELEEVEPLTAPDIANAQAVSQHNIEQPFLLRGRLREYQRNGLDWLAGLVRSGTNGILADEMGLGKTIQTIALLAWLACERQTWGPHLIIVPTSVMLNWEMEFKRFAPGFKILTYFGTPQQRKRKRRGWNKEDTWHVCITSYQLVIQDQVVFRGKRWKYMVLDEAHNIKNFRSQRWQALLNFNAQHRLLLTGTPLQNNLVELWSLLYFLMPSSRATQMMPAGFASLDDFQEWFAKPVDQMVEEGEEADEEARKTITKLHQVLRPYLLRRLKADVEKQMPAKYEHVVYCRLSKRQRYLYDDFMSRASTQATLQSGNFMSILSCLMQLRKVCNHPDLFEVRPIVTSYAIDAGVYAYFGQNTAPKFTFFDLQQTTQFSVCIPNLERESKILSLERQSVSANSALEQEVCDFSKELKIMGEVEPNFATVDGWAKYNLYRRRTERLDNRKRSLLLNKWRTDQQPIYGLGLREMLKIFREPIAGVSSLVERESGMKSIIQRFAFVTSPIIILDYPETEFGPALSSRVYFDTEFAPIREAVLFHEAQVRLSIVFPDKRLLQYDCGKLQKLAVLLRDLISNGHRCLIFTQMTRVLDILEQFMSLHGWRYLRLDGATRIEQRQALTERFNKDASIPVFILSTRSGGLGINLTGADTVIFYDSDWNPAMDRQCQDRCHRIGQTRDVHIYRLVSEFTIEANILRKATQKTVLDNVVIQEGDFTTEYFSRMSVQDILGNDGGRNTAAPTLEELESSGPKRLEAAMAEAEDRDDQLAANFAISEARMDNEEFGEARSHAQSRSAEVNGGRAIYVKKSSSEAATSSVPNASANSTSTTPDAVEMTVDGQETGLEELADEVGHIDDWMIRVLERGDLTLE